MNRILKIAPLVLGLALAGCGDSTLTETPESFITTDAYYRTQADMERATIAAYQPVFQSVWNFWYPINNDLASDP